MWMMMIVDEMGIDGSSICGSSICGLLTKNEIDGIWMDDGEQNGMWL